MYGNEKKIESTNESFMHFVGQASRTSPLFMVIKFIFINTGKNLKNLYTGFIAFLK